MNNMTNIPYSPPFMPLDENLREIWAVLVSLNEPFTEIKIFEYIPHKKLVVEINNQRKEVDLSWAFKNITNAEIEEIIKKLKEITT